MREDCTIGCVQVHLSGKYETLKLVFSLKAYQAF